MDITMKWGSQDPIGGSTCKCVSISKSVQVFDSLDDFIFRALKYFSSNLYYVLVYIFLFCIIRIVLFIKNWITKLKTEFFR